MNLHTFTISIQLGLRTENAACATKASMKQKEEQKEQAEKQKTTEQT